MFISPRTNSLYSPLVMLTRPVAPTRWGMESVTGQRSRARKTITTTAIILSICCVPILRRAQLLSAWHLWTHLILKITQWGKDYYIYILQMRHWDVKWFAQGYGVFGNGRAGVQAALKEQVSGAANWICQNLHVKTSRKAITFDFRASRSTKKQNKGK